MKKISSGILWEGLSKIDGSPIVVIAISKSTNSKTGDMVQTYIIRSDIDPITANRIGADYSICGSCPHRGVVNLESSKGLATNRSCYVNIGQGVLAVYKAFKKGNYPILTVDQQIKLGFNRMVRIGTYGDGGAVPSEAFEYLTAQSKGVTAYTHQDQVTNPSSVYMRSADSLDQAKVYWSNGKRTFRIVSDYSEKQSNEVICPSEKGIKCLDCGLCDGSKVAKSVVIQVHGIGKNNFNNNV